MGWLGRLVGKEPPKVPAGGRAFADMDRYGQRWCVRVQMPGDQPDSRCKRIGPTFRLQTTAYAYLAWVTGEAATFSYPEGEA